MMFTSILNDVARIALAILLNSLWQGALIALVAWGVLRVFSRANAATRYAIWAFALLAMIAIPVITSIPRVSVESAPAWHSHVLAPPTVISKDESLPTAPIQQAQPAPAQPKPAAYPAFHFQVPSVHVPTLFAVIAFAVWSLAALFVLTRLIFAIVSLERLKRDSLPLDIAYRDQMPQWNAALKEFRDVRLCVSDAIEVPVAIGLFDAMILLPRHLVESLDPKEIDQIALHELGHLRRNDDWTNAIQRIACSLLFFNPAAWLVSRQLDLEREVACDDYVLQATGAARSYAFCLTRIAEVTSWPRQGVAAAPGVFLTRRNISIRIERLLRSGRTIGSAVAPEIAATVGVALVAVLVLLRTMTPSVAYTLPSSESKNQKVDQKLIVQLVPAPNQPGQKVSQRAPLPSIAAPHAHQIAKSSAPAAAQAIGAAVNSAVAPAVDAAVSAAVSTATQTAQQISQAMADDDKTSYTEICTGCDYSHSNLSGKDFSKRNLNGSDFAHSNLQGARFDGARLTGANFQHADMRNASFVNANMVGCNLEQADLTGAKFDGAKLMGCNVNAPSLSPAQARVFLQSCMGCNFEGADLHGMDLRNIHVKGANFQGVNFSGADLSGANFVGVNFEGASFNGTKLNNAHFMGCNLAAVDLHKADTTGASFMGSNMRDAQSGGMHTGGNPTQSRIRCEASALALRYQA